MMRKLVASLTVAAAIVIGAAACGGSGSSSETGQKIEIAAGSLAIEEVELAERFPPGCDPGPGCDQAKPGYRVLVVWLKALEGEAADVSGDLFEASNGVYVVGASGTRTQRYLGGLWEGRLVVAFTPRVSEHGFTLHWPGNAPTSLGK